MEQYDTYGVVVVPPRIHQVLVHMPVSDIIYMILAYDVLSTDGMMFFRKLNGYTKLYSSNKIIQIYTEEQISGTHTTSVSNYHFDRWPQAIVI